MDRTKPQVPLRFILFIAAVWTAIAITSLSAATNAVVQSTTNAVPKSKLPTIIRGTVVEEPPDVARGVPEVVRGSAEAVRGQSESHVFQYTGYDAGGVLVVTGRLSIVITTNTMAGLRRQRNPAETEGEDERLVTGTRSFGPVGPPNANNPQVGSGKLNGLAKGSSLRLNLNPNMMDNNVYLNGELSGNRFTGTWSYSTIAGIQAKGKFVAK